MDAHPSVESTVPRTPTVTSPDREAVLASPVYRVGQTPLYEADSLGGRGPTPAAKGAFLGAFAVVSSGLVFLTGGRREGVIQRLREALHHTGLHAAVEVAGLPALLAAGGIGKFLNDRAMRAALHHPETFVIPAPQIVALEGDLLEGERTRAAICVTAQDDSRQVMRYWVSPSGLSPQNVHLTVSAIWLTRFNYELAVLLAVQLERLVPDETRDRLLDEFVTAWFAGQKARLDSWEWAANVVLEPARVTLTNLKLEAFYHLRRFRKIPIVGKAHEGTWEEFERLLAGGYMPTCFRCWKRATEPGAAVCASCGTPYF